MVEVLEDDHWWDGHIEAQEQREGVWWAKVRYRRDDGQHGAWFAADQIGPDETDYSARRDV
jgi:hypothetical protein